MTGRQDVFQQAMNEGHSAAWDQLWERAAGYYRQALAEMPDNPQALTSLGLALIELQEFDEALKYYLKAARTLPDDPMPLEKITQLYERTGNLDQAAQTALRAAELYLKNKDVGKAIENWERVVRLNPENLQAHSRLALVLERLGDKMRAVTEYLAVASLLQEAGQERKARETVQQALVVLPDHPEAQQAWALLNESRPLPRPERPRGATAPLRMSQVRQLKPPKEAEQLETGMDPVALASQRALTVLAGMLFEAADEEHVESGRRGLQEIVTGNTGALRKSVDLDRISLHLSQLVDLQAHAQFAQAADELQRAMDLGLDNAAASFDLGYLYVQTGRLESAMRLLQQSVKHMDYALASHLLLGDMLRKRGKLKEAAIEYLEALRQADGMIVPSRQQNDLHQLYEPLLEALRHQNDPLVQERLCDNISAMLMRVDWRSQMSRARAQLPQRGGEALPIPLAEVLLQTRGSQVIEMISVIYDLIQAGNLRSAMEEAFYALQEAPTYLPLHTLMADILVGQGTPEAAAEKYSVIAHTYSVRNEVQPAISMYRRIVELAPTDVNVRGRLIEHLVTAGMADQAIQEYLQLTDLYYSLADLSMARKTLTEALRAAQQANVDRALRVKILHRMADIDLQSLDWRQALRIFEQIRTLQPADESARLNLVDLNYRMGQEQQALSELDNYLAYLTSNNQSARAIAFLEGLVRENPTRLPFRRRLADLFRLLGRKAEAITQYDKLGDLLLEAGDGSGAIQVIELIVTLDPPNKDEYELLLHQLRQGS